MCVGNTLGLYLRKGVSLWMNQCKTVNYRCDKCLKLHGALFSSPLPVVGWQKAKGASTLLSVLPAHLASISASVGSSVMTQDSAFRKLSVWPTFPAFTSASLLTNASFSILRIVWPGFCKPVMQRVNKGIKFQITHFLGNTNRSEWLHACRVARLKVP